jgi:uncharacterized protein (DUF433 family)
MTSPPLNLDPLPVPLRLDEGGTLRVGDSRVPLDRVIECHRQGLSPEAIVEAFDTLRLADVYTALAYYLNHRDEVEVYLQRREKQAEDTRSKIEASQPARPDFWEELKARKARMENPHAAAGH